jgi:hypothetical protein
MRRDSRGSSIGRVSMIDNSTHFCFGRSSTNARRRFTKMPSVAVSTSTVPTLCRCPTTAS